MAKTVNEELVDEAIRHTLHLDRLTDQEVAAIRKVLEDEILPDIARQIGGVKWGDIPLDDVRLHQLNKIIREGLHVDTMRARLFGTLSDLSLDEAGGLVNTMKKLLPVDIEMVVPSPQQLEAIVFEDPFNGKVMGEWFGKLGDDIQQGIMRDFRVGMVEGKDVQSMAADILEGNFDAFSSRGILRAIHDSEAVTRTAINLVNTRAREATYQANADVIKGVQYIATLDDRTTLICMDLHGQTFPIDDGPRPPQHYNCRSTTVPVVKSWEEMGIPAADISQSTMASMNGQVAAVPEFETWLKGQDKDVQDRLLGPVRADLWRKGEVPNLSGFLAKDGGTTPLKNLGFTRTGKPLETTS